MQQTKLVCFTLIALLIIVSNKALALDTSIRIHTHRHFINFIIRLLIHPGGICFAEKTRIKNKQTNKPNRENNGMGKT